MCGYDYGFIVDNNLQFKQGGGIVEDNFAKDYEWEDVHWLW